MVPIAILLPKLVLIYCMHFFNFSNMLFSNISPFISFVFGLLYGPWAVYVFLATFWML